MAKPEGMTKSENQRNHFDEEFWDDVSSVVREEPGEKRVYDLEERTARFGEVVIDFAKTIPQDAVTNRLIGQLVGAATSVGANMSKPMTPYRRRNFLRTSVHAGKRRAKRNISFE
jgi:hypothetical protein